MKIESRKIAGQVFGFPYAYIISRLAICRRKNFLKFFRTKINPNRSPVTSNDSDCILARHKELESLTFGSVDQRSIQLS